MKHKPKIIKQYCYCKECREEAKEFIERLKHNK